MRFFGPSLPLGQNALVYYTSIKRDVKFVLHRWRLLRHSLFFQAPNYFWRSDFNLSLNEKDKFSETYQSFSFIYIIYHDSLIKIMIFMTTFRFSINPLVKLPLLTCDSQYTGYALWRSIGLTFDAWKICNCLIRDMIL